MANAERDGPLGRIEDEKACREHQGGEAQQRAIEGAGLEPGVDEPDHDRAASMTEM